jgi:lipopolysaccharide transport system ATP-binding protein
VDAKARLRSARVIADDGLAHQVDIRKPVDIEIDYEAMEPCADLFAGITLYDQAGTTVFFSANWAAQPSSGAAGAYRARCRIPGNLLSEGLFRVAIEISTRSPVYVVHGVEHDALAFTVVDRGEPGSVRERWPHALPGVVRPQLAWSTHRISSEKVAS